ncbi:MAG: hypothetical protein CMG71_05045 [Candidatus Marinimicrobia bacterium]|nr:hypothetical protein [Candidatus Neomarinimicrobiota bacterium]|tara:strand:+ start:8683 stop:9852 length:1170 start_codon:yes stop_codon:yes gene_type:complete
MSENSLRSFNTLPLFPTAVVGSLPRPLWVLDALQMYSKEYVANRRESQPDWEMNILNRQQESPFSKADLNETLNRGIDYVLSMQKMAGVDIVSDGEWRRRSFTEVICAGLSGFEPDILNGFVSIVTSKIERKNMILEDEALFLLRNCNGLFKMALPTPFLLSHRHWSQKHSDSVYPRREDFIDDLIPIIAQEAVDLIRLGVPYIQFDDPGLCLLVDKNYQSQFGDFYEELDVATSSLNGVISLIREKCDQPEFRLGLHLCRAHRKRGIGGVGDYSSILDEVLQIDVDQYLLEFSVAEAGEYEVLEGINLGGKTIGLGIIDVRTEEVRDPEIIFRNCERIFEFIEPTKLWLNPDCGFAPGSTNPIPLTECYRKLKCLSEVALMMREKYSP